MTLYALTFNNIAKWPKIHERNLSIGHGIIEIDLKSIEPRLYLSLIKGIDVKDAYEKAKTHMNAVHVGYLIPSVVYQKIGAY